MSEKPNNLKDGRVWQANAEEYFNVDQDADSHKDIELRLEMAKAHALMEIAEQLAELNRSISSATRGGLDVNTWPSSTGAQPT